MKIDEQKKEASLKFKPSSNVKLILVDPLPKNVRDEEKQEHDRRKKRKRLIFLAKKMHAAASGGTFLTGCNIADEAI